jgi:hypothetical protein
MGGLVLSAKPPFMGEIFMQLPSDVTIRSDVPFAAGELTRYITMITGREPCDQGYPIRVSVTKAGGEGYTVEVSENGAQISSGSVRGAVYGAYAFLESIGCQFLAEDCEVIPRTEHIDLPLHSFAGAPAFEYRDVYWRGALNGQFALKLRLNSARADIPPDWGGRVMFYNYSHTFEQLVSPEEFFDTHPEYFSMINGVRIRDKAQLCLTNPDVLAIVTQRVLGWMREHKECTIFSVAMNDWYSPCQCPGCKALDEREGSSAGTMIAFVNAVADAVKSEFPNNFIHTFAYLYCRKAPRAIRPRPNVIVRLCSIECCFSHPMAECDYAVERIDVETTSARKFVPSNRLFRQDLAGWAGICDHLYIWDYTTNFCNYLQPFPNLDVLQPNLQLFRDHHVRGVFEQGNYAFGKASAFAPLKIYLLSKLLWNPDEDVDLLISRFVRGYYGEPAAGALMKYLELCYDAAASEHMSLFDGADAPYLTEAFLAEGMKWFHAALMATTDPTHGERIRREELSLRYVYLVSLPLEYPNRNALIDAFAKDAMELGIGELFERRELNASFDCMKESRYAARRENVPYAVYRL